MKYILIIILFNLVVKFSLAQSGFSRLYDFDRPVSSFVNMIGNEDTLELFGVIFHDSIPNRQGFLFAQIDTNGNVLKYSTYFDSLGDDLTARFSNSITKLRNNEGYAMVGQLLARANGILLLVDNEGNQIAIKEYPDNTSLVDYFEKIVQTESGFLIFGGKQRSDFQLDAFVLGTDKDGNKLWEKYFDSPGRQWFINSVYPVDNNTYVLGISTTSPSNANLSNLKIQTIIFAIDSLGNEQWRWESPLGLEEGGAVSLHRRPDNSWIYLSARVDISPSQDYFTSQPKIIARDENFNLLWEKTVGWSTSPENYFTSLLETFDGNWVAAGTILSPSTSNTHSGLTYKVSNSGDSIWSRLDTVLYHENNYTSHILSGAIELTSKSLIFCGTVIDYAIPTKTWAWLIKMSPDGCIENVNCTPLSESSVVTAQITMFPNPTNSFLYFENNGLTGWWDNVEIRTLEGKIAKRVEEFTDDPINVGTLSSGAYFVYLFQQRKTVAIKLLIKE